MINLHTGQNCCNILPELYSTFEVKSMVCYKTLLYKSWHINLTVIQIPNFP